MKKPNLRRVTSRLPTDRLPPWAPLAVLLVLAIGLSALVVPSVHNSSETTDISVEALGRGGEPAGARKSRSVASSIDGYVIRPRSSGEVSIPLRFDPAEGERPVLRLWVYGSAPIESTVTVVAPGGERKELGEAGYWVGKPFDLSDTVTSGTARIEVSATNPGRIPILFFDQATVASSSGDADVDSSTVLVVLWLMALVAAALQMRGRLRRHWPLVPAVGLLVALSWDAVQDAALVPLDDEPANLWREVMDASTFSLHSGLLSGSFETAPAFAVQLYHVLTALVGEGTSGPYAASVLTAVLALCALYALGNRVAGRVGAVTVTVLVLLADPFRDAAASGTSLPALILAASLFVYAVHICVAEASRYALGVLGAIGALAFLADPTWVFGIVAAIVLLGVLYGVEGDRRRAIGVGLAVFAVLILPNRISTADQHDGNLFADMTTTATFVRNVEFAGEGHGAPSEAAVDADPLGGKRVGLVPYLVEDHSLVVLAGGTLTGTYDALAAFGRRDESELAGLLAFVVGLLGALYLLIVPRLRLLLVVPILLGVPQLFFQSRGVGDAFVHGVMLWPAFVAAGGVLVYVAANLIRERSSGAAEAREPAEAT